MEPEDIDKVASAVLAIKLPSSPDEIKGMIQDIQKTMENFTHITEDLENLEDQAKLAKDLKNKANEILYVHPHHHALIQLQQISLSGL